MASPDRSSASRQAAKQAAPQNEKKKKTLQPTAVPAKAPKPPATPSEARWEGEGGHSPAPTPKADDAPPCGCGEPS